MHINNGDLALKSLAQIVIKITSTNCGINACGYNVIFIPNDVINIIRRRLIINRRRFTV